MSLRLRFRVWMLRRLEKTQYVRWIMRDAWDEGWDKGREIKEPACPNDHNPYAEKNESVIW